MVTPKLAALQAYELSLRAPKAPWGSFDQRSAQRGKRVFEGAARCAECHVPPLFTEPGWNLHTPKEIGIDGFQAHRSPTNAYRSRPWVACMLAARVATTMTVASPPCSMWSNTTTTTSSWV